MKKMVAFTLALSMIVLFAGCKNNSNNCRWTPFKKDQTVCYTPCNSCDIPVVDDCCPSYGGDVPVVTSGCSSCSMGGGVSTSVPVVEPIPGN
jgi:hypothetical protein